MTNKQLEYWRLLRQQQIYRAYAATAASKKKNAYDNLKAVANSNGFLNYIEYSPKNIDSQLAASYLKNPYALVSLGGCTGFADLLHLKVLRQLDWYYNEETEFIIKMNKDESKGINHSSIGVTASTPKLTRQIANDLITTGKYDLYFEILPYITVDGINDDGVYAQSNVVMKNGIDIDINNDPTKTDCCVMMLVRYILDHFDRDDVTESRIEEKLNELHIYGTPALGDFNPHILIANSLNSFIIEFNSDSFEIKRYIIMTNFRTNDDFTTDRYGYPDWDTVESNGIGVERWKIAADFKNLMQFDFEMLRKQLYYSNAYKNGDDDVKYAWLTEFTSDELTVTDAKNVANNVTPNKHDAFLAAYAYWKNRYENRQRSDSKDIGTWITTHSCIYDLSNSSFNIQVQEGIDEDTKTERGFSWDVTLDGLITEHR